MTAFGDVELRFGKGDGIGVGGMFNRREKGITLLPGLLQLVQIRLLLQIARQRDQC